MSDAVLPRVTPVGEARPRRWWLAHRSLAVGGALSALLAGMALVSVFWTPYDPTRMEIRNRFAPPSWEHWMGTDQFGRDVLSIIMAGARNSIVVQATVQFALAVLAEAALSYLGIGSQPPTSSWGRMLSDVQTLIFLHPMLAVYPGAAIALSVLGLNLRGDGLRDLADPRLVRKR